MSILDVPVDESLLAVAEAIIVAGEIFAVTPDPPDPGPGDPGVDPIPATPRRLGRRTQVLACRPVHHTTINEFTSAQVDHWTDRFGVGEASVVVDRADPALLDLPGRTTTARGRTVQDPDLKGLEVTIGCEGSRVFSGIIQEPVNLADDRIQLPLKSPESLFSERTLGETEQHDYYEGRGAFPTTSLAGWDFDSNVTHSFDTSHPYEGARSLSIEAADAAGRVYGPWVLMPGQDGITRYPVGSALVRAPEGTPCWVGVEVRLAGSEINHDFSIDNLGTSNDGVSVWQGPVAGRGRLQPLPVDHQVRVFVQVPRNKTVTLDLIRLQWPTLTGYPNDQDLSLYIARILRDAQFGPGGSKWGMTSHVLSSTGVLDRLTWPHQDDHPVDEAMSSVGNMIGGPDYWVSPGWRLLIAARRGQDRRDVALTSTEIIECEMTIDPAGQVDELRGLTDIGSGSYRHVFGVNAPVIGDRRRIRQLVQAPNGQGYDAARRWVEGQAEFAARTPFSARATVDFDFGAQFAVGDGVRFAYDTPGGSPAWWGAVRVGARSMYPRTDRCVLEVGTDPVVAL